LIFLLLLPLLSLLPGFLMSLSLSQCPVISRIHCCHHHLSWLSLNHCSLLLLSCHHSLPLPLMSTTLAITVHRPPSPPSNANARYCQLPPPLSNTISTDVTLLLPLNTVKLCHHDQAPLLIAAVVHYHHQMLPLNVPPSMRRRHHPTVFHCRLQPLLIVE
jgi:hypothetical protein